MIATLPGYSQAFTTLRNRGEQFPTSARDITPMKGVWYRYPEDKQNRPAQIDDNVLRHVENVYGGTPTLHSALAARGVHMKPLTDLLQLIEDIFESDRLIWGFSGYGMAGHNYDFEARAMVRVLHLLRKQNHTPALVCDGGVSDGVPGLSGVLAARFGIPSLGYVPLEGLFEIGPRTHMAVRMDTYSERQRLVGYTADALVAQHGGPGTIDECRHTIDGGGVVLHIMSQDGYHRGNSLSANYASEFRDVLGKRFFVCDDLSLLPIRLEEVRKAAMYATMSRSRRLNTLGQDLQ